MTLELAGKRPDQTYIDCPGWIALLVLFWLAFEDALKWLRPRSLRLQIYLLAHYDLARRDLRAYGWLWPVARIFVSFWLVFLLIEFLEKGVIEWLH